MPELHSIRSTLALLVLLCLVTPLLAGRENIRTVTHYSEVLGKQKTYSIYVPRPRVEDERFPVLFMLHGAWGDHTDWIERTDLVELAEAYQMMLVLPDGDLFSWYVNSTQERGSDYETYIVEELVGEIDALFPTVGTREARGIMGLSMGGHGALLLAAKHPEVFSSASSLSGVLNITNHPNKWNIASRLGPLEENREAWEANSVWHQAERFRDGDVRILFDCGEGDVPTGILADNHQFRDRLVELGIPHIWRELPGAHDWVYWGVFLQSHLNFHQANMIEHTDGITGFWKTYFRRLARFFEDSTRWSLEPPDGMVLLTIGSSSVEGLPDELLSEYNVVNRGISADMIGVGTRGVSHRHLVTVFDVPADFIMIKIGRNDLGNRYNNGTPSITEIVEHYAGVLDVFDMIHPEAPIFVVSSFPTSGRYGHLVPSIIEYNDRLAMMVEDRPNVRFLNVHALLRDESGALREEYSHDGLHLTRAGYEIWATVVDEAIQQRIAELEDPEHPVNLPDGSDTESPEAATSGVE